MLEIYVLDCAKVVKSYIWLWFPAPNFQWHPFRNINFVVIGCTGGFVVTTAVYGAISDDKVNIMPMFALVCSVLVYIESFDECLGVARSIAVHFIVTIEYHVNRISAWYSAHVVVFYIMSKCCCFP